MVNSVEVFSVRLWKNTAKNITNFLCKHAVPASKQVGEDLLKIGASELAEVFKGTIKLQTTAESVQTQSSETQLGSSSNKRTASKIFPTKDAD